MVDTNEQGYCFDDIRAYAEGRDPKWRRCNCRLAEQAKLIRQLGDICGRQDKYYKRIGSKTPKCPKGN